MGKIWKTLCLILILMLMLGFRQQRKQGREALFPEWIRQAEKVETVVATLREEEITHQKNLARWYNYNLELGTKGLEAAYGTILNFGQGRMAVLGVPEWELRMPICHGSGGPANHDPATPLPVGGRGNHTILYLTEPLPWTEEMGVYIDCLGQRRNYRVVYVGQAGETADPMYPEGAELLTLIFDKEGVRMQVFCRRSGELVIRQETSGAYFPWAAPAAALPVLFLVWIWRGKWSAKTVERGRIYVFCRKKRGKTKLF